MRLPRKTLVLIVVIATVSCLLVSGPKRMESYTRVGRIDFGSPHFTRAELDEIRAESSSRKLEVTTAEFSKSSPAHVIESPKEKTTPVNSRKFFLALSPSPYPKQKGGSCTGHAFGQLIRYTLWRYSCNTRAQCLSFDPPRPCPYFLWSIGRCGPTKDINFARQKYPTCQRNAGGKPPWMAMYVARMGFVLKGDWRVDGKDIGDLAQPFRYFPDPATFAKAEQNRVRYLAKPYRFAIVGGKTSMYNALLSGHAILAAINTKGDGIFEVERRTVAGWTVDVFKQQSGEFPSGHAFIFVGAIMDSLTGEVYFHVQNSWGKQRDHVYMSYSDFASRRGYSFTLLWD
jgi:hypothetical protein